MRTTTISMVLVLCATSLAQQQGAGQTPWLEEVVQVIRERDPASLEEARRQIETGRPEALRDVVGHAIHLLDRERIAAEEPRKHELLEQDRAADERCARVAGDLDNGEIDPKRRTALKRQLRAALRQWFDLRQSMRWMEVEQIAAMLSREREHLRGAEENPEAAREDWLGRLADRSAEGVRSLEAQISELDEIRVIAPMLVQHIEEHDPQAGLELSWLGATAEHRFLAKLSQYAKGHPEVVEEARGAERDQIERRAGLRRVVVAARVSVSPWVREDGSVAVPEDERAGVVARVDELVGAEIEMARFHLGQVEQELAEQKRRLEERVRLREVLIELQLARMTGRAEIYDW